MSLSHRCNYAGSLGKAIPTCFVSRLGAWAREVLGLR